MANVKNVAPVRLKNCDISYSTSADYSSLVPILGGSNYAEEGGDVSTTEIRTFDEVVQLTDDPTPPTISLDLANLNPLLLADLTDRAGRGELLYWQVWSSPLGEVVSVQTLAADADLVTSNALNRLTTDTAELKPGMVVKLDNGESSNNESYAVITSTDNATHATKVDVDNVPVAQGKTGSYTIYNPRIRRRFPATCDVPRGSCDASGLFTGAMTLYPQSELAAWEIAIT